MKSTENKPTSSCPGSHKDMQTVPNQQLLTLPGRQENRAGSSGLSLDIGMDIHLFRHIPCFVWRKIPNTCITAAFWANRLQSCQNSDLKTILALLTSMWKRLLSNPSVCVLDGVTKYIPPQRPPQMSPGLLWDDLGPSWPMLLPIRLQESLLSPAGSAWPLETARKMCLPAVQQASQGRVLGRNGENQLSQLPTTDHLFLLHHRKHF